MTDRLPALVATFSDAAAAASVMAVVPATEPPPGLSPAARRPAPEQLSALEDLVRGFLLSNRSPRTRQAYTADLTGWLTWCSGLQVDVLAAGIHHADAYLRLLAEHGDPRHRTHPGPGQHRPADLGPGPRPCTASTATSPATEPSPAHPSPASNAPPSTTSR